jgi:hypothetical protein
MDSPTVRSGRTSTLNGEAAKLLVLLSLLSAVLLLGTPRAFAASPITMQVSSPLMLQEKPFSLYVRSGRWFPIAVTLSNTGEAVHGTLTLSLHPAVNGSVTIPDFYTEVDLPANAARKRVWLYGRVERDIDRVEVTFQGRGFKTLMTDGLVTEVADETRLVLTISDNDEKLSYLATLAGRGLALKDPPKQPSTSYPGGAPGTQYNPKGGYPAPGAPATPGFNPNLPAVRPLGTSHEMIPWRWIGLDAVDMLVLQDFTHSALRPDQIAALRGYVAGGGSVLVLGGANWQTLAASPLNDLWPVTPQAMRTASPVEVGNLVAQYLKHKASLSGADRLGGAPVVVTQGTLRPEARVVRGDGSAPLMTVRDFGAGRVILLAADPTKPPFMGWSGNAALWADIFSQSAHTSRLRGVDADYIDSAYSGYYGRGYYGSNGYNYDPGDQTGGTTGQLLAALARSPQLKTPPVGYIAWFLALYVFFLVPVNYCVLRYFDRRELAWVTIPIIVIVFSVTSYATALSIKGRAILTREVNIVQGTQGAGEARADSMLWLFSPSRTTYDISGNDPQTVVGDYIGQRNSSNSGGVIREPEENQSFTLERAPINMWADRSFVGQSVLNVGRSIHPVVSGNTVVLQNDTPFDLHGVVVVGWGHLRDYQHIAAGQKSGKPSTVDDSGLSDTQLTGRIESASDLDRVLPPAEMRRDQGISSALLRQALGTQPFSSNEGPLVVAWSDKSAAPLSIGQENAKAQNLTVFVFRLNPDALTRRYLTSK